MCCEIFPIPANVPTLHYYSHLGGVEKISRAGGPKNLCLGAATDTLSHLGSSLSLSRLHVSSFEKWGTGISCLRCRLALKRLSLVSLLSLAFWIWCQGCLLFSHIVICDLAHSSKFISFKEPATLRLLYHTNRNIKKSSPMPAIWCLWKANLILESLGNFGIGGAHLLTVMGQAAQVIIHTNWTHESEKMMIGRKHVCA